MTPDDVLARQIELYRAMTGEQRLAIALRLHELSCDIAREGIRRQHPDATEEQVDEHLRQRIRASYALDEDRKAYLTARFRAS